MEKQSKQKYNKAQRKTDLKVQVVNSNSTVSNAVKMTKTHSG